MSGRRHPLNLQRDEEGGVIVRLIIIVLLLILWPIVGALMEFFGVVEPIAFYSVGSAFGAAIFGVAGE